METINNLKSKILEANNLYRIGKPIMTDQQFDDLCDKLEKMMDPSEWNSFRNSLHEEAGKVKHPYIMGSLNKVKYEEPQTVKDFLNKNIVNEISISKKVDGISCRLHYSDGKLISASTRGDGFKGVDLTDKIGLVKFIPSTIDFKDEIDIRGELVILRNDFDQISDKFANARNACSGIMGSKYFDKNLVSLVSFVCYTILGPNFTKKQQFEFLDKYGFKTSNHWNVPKSEFTSDENGFIERLFKLAENEEAYECDGLVISDVNYINENTYRPEKQIAFKINQQMGVTKLIDVDFSSVSKDGKLAPVGILEPIELGGVIVSRVSLFNLDFIEKFNLKYGSMVKIIRSGDVIPKLICLDSNPENATDIVYPEVCPVCGQPVIREGIDLRCKNKECSAQVSDILTQFIRKLKIKNASNASLRNFGINNYEDILKFIPNRNLKMQMKFYEELEAKMFTASKKKLICSTNFPGLSDILLGKIIDYYSLEFIESNHGNQKIENYMVKGIPNGVGQITLEKFVENIDANFDVVNAIISDSRYHYTEEEKTEVKSNGKSLCFTGALNSMGRSQASKLAMEAGFEVKGGVTKDLTYLVTNDTESGSSKNRKAQEYGIKIINEEEFLKMIKGDDSLDNL